MNNDRNKTSGSGSLNPQPGPGNQYLNRDIGPPPRPGSGGLPGGGSTEGIGSSGDFSKLGGGQYLNRDIGPPPKLGGGNLPGGGSGNFGAADNIPAGTSQVGITPGSQYLNRDIGPPPRADGGGLNPPPPGGNADISRKDDTSQTSDYPGLPSSGNDGTSSGGGGPVKDPYLGPPLKGGDGTLPGSNKGDGATGISFDNGNQSATDINPNPMGSFDGSSDSITKLNTDV